MSGTSPDPRAGDVPEAASPASDPGARVSRSTIQHADVAVRDPETGPRLHRSLFERGLDDALLEALRELPGERQGEFRAMLSKIGVDALDGVFATLAADARAALDWADDNEIGVDADGFDAIDWTQHDVEPPSEAAPIATLIHTTRSLGHGSSPQQLPTSREDLAIATPPIFARSLETTPTIVVEITGSWFDSDHGPTRQQRVDVLELLVALAQGCEVVIKPSGIAARHLWERHRDVLPAHVTARLNPRRDVPEHVASDELPETVREQVAEARAELSPDGSLAAALRALERSSSHLLTYHDLERELQIEGSHPRVLAKRLEERGLAERTERPDGRAALSMLPAGQRLVEIWRETVGEQSRLPVQPGDDRDNVDPNEDDEDLAGRYDPPKNLLPCRVNPREHEEGGEDRPAPDAEAADAAADSPDLVQQFQHGAVSCSWMDRSRHTAVSAAAESGAITLLDAEFSKQTEEGGDGREPAWSFDRSNDVLVVGAEYHNPMQYWTAIARALSEPRTFSKVLNEDLVGAHLEHLDISDANLLRDGRCLGWLPDEATEDLTELSSQLNEAYNDLLDLTLDLQQEQYDDRDAFRREILRYALGLAGTMSHLLDLAGVEVVREVRIPDFSDDFSKGGHSQRRRDLCKTIAIGATIQSRYGNFAAYRQLLEDRPKKIRQAGDPRVDADDPIGKLDGSIVISGHGVEDLQDELRYWLQNPKEIRADAPEFAVHIPLRVGDSPLMTRRVAKQMGEHKNLDVDRKCWAALHGFVKSPYGAAEAMNNLQTEAIRREMFLDEIRVAVGSLDDDQLLEDGNRSGQAGLIALLRADEPISQAELARRAGITSQSWRNNRDALISAGLVTETEDGWRLTLPFADERYEDTDVDISWIIDPETDRVAGDDDSRLQEDYVEVLAAELGMLGNAIVDDCLSWPIYEGAPPKEALAAMGCSILTRFVEAAAPIEPKPTSTYLGPELVQQSIEEAVDGVTDPQKLPKRMMVSK